MKLWFLNKDQKPGDILSNLRKDAKSKMSKVPNLPKNLNLKLPANINLKILTDLTQQMIKALSNPESSKPSGPTGPRVHMKFPYTIGAKIAQFPYKYYYKNNWIFRYYPWGFLACVPVFWYISRMSNSEANKAKWKEIRRLEKEEARHKFD